MKFNSKLINLAEIVEQEEHWAFTVPIYQRLYVWGNDQVLTLLNDLINAYERDEDLFFLGGTLAVEQPSEIGRSFELIDGQQRFTTLWLLCYAWKEALTPFLSIQENDRIVPRISFSIRPTVNQFLSSLVFTKDGKEIDEAKATEKMREAIATIRSVFEKRPKSNKQPQKDYLHGLSQFIFERVKFVFTTVPHQTDLNKLFEVINNRGVQLQHHEILKARMLDALNKSERRSYATLWEACADMDNFVERSLAGNSHLKGKDIASFFETDAAKEGKEKLCSAEVVLQALQQEDQEDLANTALRMDEILHSPTEQKISESDDLPESKNKERWVRSIVGFPMFLQHALRIWLHRNNLKDLPRILDRELLVLFDDNFFLDSNKEDTAERVRSFIKLLWELRYQFDKHFIKWVDKGEEEVHQISRLSLSTSDKTKSLSRSRESEANRGFGLLQSMLYHSQEITTHYWLSPLLNFIHQNPGKAEGYYKYLRHLDTHLLGSNIDGSLVERTHTFLKDPWNENQLNHNAELTLAEGVHFRHYWFYKLEFVLWFLEVENSEQWKQFRFTAKNSVEHISPQQPVEQDDNTVSDVMLNCFGNLALVSRSINSEYSNLPFNEKKQRFSNKNKAKVDSLKMHLIYKNDTWSDSKALAHQVEMIDYLNTYSRKLKDTP